jgi:hypothetical protein
MFIVRRAKMFGFSRLQITSSASHYHSGALRTLLNTKGFALLLKPIFPRPPAQVLESAVC